MYICSLCKQCSQPGQAMHRRTVYRTVSRQGGGTRQEIAREYPVCRDCSGVGTVEVTTSPVPVPITATGRKGKVVKSRLVAGKVVTCYIDGQEVKARPA